MKLDASILKNLIQKQALTQQDLKNRIYVAEEQNSYTQIEQPKDESIIQNTKHINDATRTILKQAYETLPNKNTPTLYTRLTRLLEEVKTEK